MRAIFRSKKYVNIYMGKVTHIRTRVMHLLKLIALACPYLRLCRLPACSSGVPGCQIILE